MSLVVRCSCGCAGHIAKESIFGGWRIYCYGTDCKEFYGINRIDAIRRAIIGGFRLA